MATAVVRRGMDAKASEYRYSIATVPEMSIVSQLQVQVCAPDSDTCHHTLKSTDASLDQWYYSRHEDRTAGANTKAVLVPANSSGSSGNAAVVGWLEVDDTETHTYRIAMTKGKTYVFDETYRKWALMSGEWRGGEHYYLPDEFRISLYTKNSAGELVPVSDFQDQPQYGWQAIAEDGLYEDGSIGYQGFGNAFGASSVAQFFLIIKNTIILFDLADLFPPGQKFRHACNVDKSNSCGPGLNIYKDKGRQLRTASYVPTKSGIYYLQVKRIRDDQPVYRDGGAYWSLAITEKPGSVSYMTVYGGIASGASHGLRSALPYYEISVEARGPTLTSITFTGDEYMDIYADGGFSGSNQFGFLPGRFDYRVGLGTNTNTVTIAATVPEMSIVSQLQVQVCAPDSDTCHHTLKSTDASLDQYYYSRIENRTAGANTKSLLVPANSSGGFSNAAVTGWLEYDDTETHTYRIAMTAGKTYVFDETYRKWALESSDWRAGAPHFYLPDEFRISLYTKNSAGQLVPVSGFQNQPEHGWQALDAEPGFQRFGSKWDTASLPAFNEINTQLQPLLDDAHQFPPGSRYRTGCPPAGSITIAGGASTSAPTEGARCAPPATQPREPAPTTSPSPVKRTRPSSGP